MSQCNRCLFPVFLLVSGAVLFTPFRGTALETVTIGQGGELDWRGAGSAVVTTIDAEIRSPLDPKRLLVTNAPGNLVELESADFPGGLLPIRIKEGENVAVGTILRGGKIDAPNVFDFGTQVGVAATGIFDRNDLLLALQELLTAEEGGEMQAFERKNYNALGTLVILDLGGRFGVNRIRFYPRNTVQSSPSTPYQSDYMRAFELYTNDGVSVTKEGGLIWGQPLWLETDNQDPVVDVAINPPQYVQNIRLRATSTVNYEIDEIEVYGVGYLSRAEYISDIFDAGQPAIWGRLSWDEEAIGHPAFSSLQIRTRTGSDDGPFVFTRTLHGQFDAPEIPYSLQNPLENMELGEYLGLPVKDAEGRQWNPGPVKDDLVNWSPFSPPYPASAANGSGILITSPSPRRYFQFRVSFQSNNLEAARLLKSLRFELLTPPFADQIVGEVFPREAEVAETTSFTYAVRPVMKTSGLRGFDTIEISTPSRVEQIDGLEILDAAGQVVAERTFAGIDDTVAVDGIQIASVANDRFAVRFPTVQEDDVLVKIRFHTGVLTYSTAFTAAVRLSAEQGVVQAIFPGDAATLADDDDPDLSGTTVLSPSMLRKGRLLDQVEMTPEVFTPNGDQINDVAVVRYNLLSLDVPRPVKIEVYDLSGRRVRVVHDGAELNGRYDDKTWDGRDEQGDLVPPGLYIVRIAVEGDSQQDQESRTVGVVY